MLPGRATLGGGKVTLCTLCDYSIRHCNRAEGEERIHFAVNTQSFLAHGSGSETVLRGLYLKYELLTKYCPVEKSHNPSSVMSTWRELLVRKNQGQEDLQEPHLT